MFAYLAGYGDIQFSYLAYTCGALSNVFHATYLLLVQKATDGKMTMVETLQLNSINTLPFLAAVCFFKGEMSDMKDLSHYTNISFLTVFMLTIILGCLLNYSLFLCTSLTSALTTSVVGGIKALAQTVIGLFTFGGVSHKLPTGLGIFISMVGTFGYVFSKFREIRKEKEKIDLRKVMSFSTVDDFSSKNGFNKDGNLNGIHIHSK